MKYGKNCCVLNGIWDEIYVRNWSGDSEMSDASTRPVQNKVIKEYVDGLLAQLQSSVNIASDRITKVEGEIELLKAEAGDAIIYF